ncbi:hypothetical protein D3C85_1006110 [compost metagenome]
MNRRIGPETLRDKIGACWKPLLISVAAATAVTALVRGIEFLIPTGQYRDLVIVWAAIFLALIIPACLHLWPRNRPATLFLLTLSALILLIEVRFGNSFLLSTGLIEPVIIPLPQ